MKKVILIRTGEIFLKGKNIAFFENTLINNIKSHLVGIEYKFVRSQNRFYIEDYEEIFQDEIIERLLTVFGLHSLSIATKIETSMDNIKKIALDYAPEEGQTFRVSCTRADKKTIPMPSFKIAGEVGGFLLSKIKDISVDLHNPDVVVNVDIRERGYTYIFSKKIMCAQGMPVGTSSKGLLLLSGGFDSPVAGWRMARRGMNISAIHFHSYPHTSLQAKEKVIDLAKVMTKYCGNIKLYIVPFTAIQDEIHESCREDFMITVMRRIMVRISEKVANIDGSKALITGESLAQVASQTIESITSTNEAVELLPVLRPLIGMDKYEIIETAEKIGTARLSELPYPDCCTVFLPEYPVIRPKLETAQKEEAKVRNLDKLIDDAIANMEILDLS